MGGRGTRSSNRSVIGTKKAIKIESLGQQHRQGTTIVGRTTWDKHIYEAAAVSNETGVLNIQYAKMNYEQISRNKIKGTTNLKAGIIETKKGFEEHNINWNAVKEVRGKTYDVQDLLKSKGFKWNRDRKVYVR